jgi:hypothetical protein
MLAINTCANAITHQVILRACGHGVQWSYSVRNVSYREWEGDAAASIEYITCVRVCVCVCKSRYKSRFIPVLHVHSYTE